MQTIPTWNVPICWPNCSRKWAYLNAISHEACIRLKRNYNVLRQQIRSKNSVTTVYVVLWYEQYRQLRFTGINICINHNIIESMNPTRCCHAGKHCTTKHTAITVISWWVCRNYYAVSISLITPILLSVRWCVSFRATHQFWFDIIADAINNRQHTHTHTRLTALFRDYPGEPVPER